MTFQAESTPRDWNENSARTYLIAAVLPLALHIASLQVFSARRCLNRSVSDVTTLTY